MSDTFYYKLTRSDGFDLYTGRTINYRACMAEGRPAKPSGGGAAALCTSVVVHASREPRSCFTGLVGERQGLDKLAMFRVQGVPVADDGRKQGFLELRVLEELPAPVWQELVYGTGSLRERIVAAQPIIDAAKSIDWLKPSGPVNLDKLQALAVEHIEALIPWQRPGYAPLGVLPVRALTNGQDAIREAGRVYAYTDAYADAYAYAAYADAAAAAAYADAAAYAADAAAAYADAAAAAAAAPYCQRLIPKLWLNMRPRYALYRAWRWQVAMGGKPNPWLPLIEMWKMGVLPIGPGDGEYAIYVPEVLGDARIEVQP